MAIVNTTRHTRIAQKVCVAKTPLTRMKGLLGCSQLAPQEALVISPCQSVHMLFMKFAIDVIFLDSQHNVVGLSTNLKPFQFSPIFWKSACAIELPAGTIKETQTELGDQITLN